MPFTPDNQRSVVVLGEVRFIRPIVEYLDDRFPDRIQELVAQSKTNLGPTSAYYRKHPETKVTILQTNIFENDLPNIVRELQGVGQSIIALLYLDTDRQFQGVKTLLERLGVKQVIDCRNATGWRDELVTCIKSLVGWVVASSKAVQVSLPTAESANPPETISLPAAPCPKEEEMISNQQPPPADEGRQISSDSLSAILQEIKGHEHAISEHYAQLEECRERLARIVAEAELARSEVTRYLKSSKRLDVVRNNGTGKSSRSTSPSNQGDGHDEHETVTHALKDGTILTITGTPAAKVFQALVSGKSKLTTMGQLVKLLGTTDKWQVNQALSHIRRQLDGQIPGAREWIVNERGQGWRWDNSASAK